MFIRLKNKMKHGKAINPDIVNADGLFGRSPVITVLATFFCCLCPVYFLKPNDTRPF